MYKMFRVIFLPSISNNLAASLYLPSLKQEGFASEFFTCQFITLNSNVIFINTPSPLIFLIGVIHIFDFSFLKTTTHMLFKGTALFCKLVSELPPFTSFINVIFLSTLILPLLNVFLFQHPYLTVALLRNLLNSYLLTKALPLQRTSLLTGY